MLLCQENLFKRYSISMSWRCYTNDLIKVQNNNNQYNYFYYLYYFYFFIILLS